MIRFSDIEIKDLSKIRHIINENNIISSLYSTYNLYALRNKYSTKISYYKGNLLIHQLSRDFDGYYSYLFPIGETNIEESINLLSEEAKTTNHNIILWGLTSEMVKKLKELFPNRFIYEEIPNWADYIYEREKLITCKMMRKSRKFQNEFQSKYVIEQISEANINKIIEFQNEWMKINVDNNDDISSLNFEHESIIESLTIWKDLPLKGFCIKVDGIIVGFAYGFLQTSDCFVMHVIKTDKSIKGLTLFLLKCLIESVDTKYINFEEDIGIEGLRIFKTRLEPAFMLKKYKALPRK